MQTREEVEGLDNCLEFSQPVERLYQAMQTQGKSVLLLKYCFFRKILLLSRLQAIYLQTLSFTVHKEMYGIYTN